MRTRIEILAPSKSTGFMTMKRKYKSRVTEIEQGTFPPLVFTTTGGMADECLRYHSRLAELLSEKEKARELRHNNFMHGSGRKCPLQFCGARSYA